MRAMNFKFFTIDDQLLYVFFFKDTVSVHRPSFYAQRFQDFMAKTVFRKIPSRKFTLSTPMKQSMGHL